MKVVIQEDGLGCGLACVAMLANKTYKQVKERAQKELTKYPPTRKNYRTSASQLRQLCALYGYKMGNQSNFKNFETLPSLAILATKYKEKETGDEWHWVVYTNTNNHAYVYDPNSRLKSNKRTNFKIIEKNCKWFFQLSKV